MASSFTQKLYWASPYIVKRWLASWHARRGDRTRFGAEYERLLADISSRDNWSVDQFLEYQNQQLRKLILHAAANVPYYRRLFAEHRIDPASIRRVDELPRLPILEKQTARERVDDFIDQRLDRSKLVKVHTSGTTGTPLDLYRSVWQESAAFAYYQVRCHALAGVGRRRNRSVSLGGHLVTAPTRRRPPFWVLNRRWKQLYMSSYHLAPAYLPYYVEAIRHFAPDYIEGYPSSVYAIAQFMVEHDCEPIAMTAAFTTAENLFDHQRQAIRRAFGCRTINQYGCGEQVLFSAECEHGSLHLSPDVGIVEVVGADDQPLPPGQQGDLVCTSLINWTQPFIRYRLGDVGALAGTPCSCGWAMPALDHVEGRIDAVLITRDGRRIGRLDPVFKGAEGVAEAQIVQNDFGTFCIRVVPGKHYTNADGSALVKNLAQRVGRADIRVELVQQIERTKAGKFLAVVRNMPAGRQS